MESELDERRTIRKHLFCVYVWGATGGGGGGHTRCRLLVMSEPRQVISNHVAIWQVKIQTSLCSLLLSQETPNEVQSVA